MTDRKRLLRGLFAFGALCLASCGGGGSLEPRFVTVHNTLSAMGLSQTGPIHEGSLPEGSEARFPFELRGGECYTFVALGGSGVANVDVRVLDAQGEEVGRDTTVDRQAAAQACPDSNGEHHVVVSMAEGDGTYAVTSWSGSVSGGGSLLRRSVASAGAGQGSCAAPIALDFGSPASGDTSGAPSSLRASCVGGDAPERVYQVDVPERSMLSAIIQTQYDGALYLLGSCGDASSELSCNDDSPNTSRSEIQATVEPGTYFIVVDGYGEESGSYELIASLTPLASLAEVCADADVLPAGQQMTGSTTGAANYFQATCASGAQSPDRVYALDVPSRSRLRLRQQTDHDGALYLRTSCEDPTTEVACNDDAQDTQHSVLTAIVDEGRYFVYSDGFSQANSGNYTLQADLVSDAGGGSDADTCDAVGSAAPGQELTVDTFEARDDYAGSCGGQGAPDAVHEISVRRRSRLRALVQSSEFTGVLYLQSSCGDASTEVACASSANVAPGQNVPGLDVVVEPGTYYLMVDGERPDSFGVATIDVQLDDLVALNRACRSAPLLRRGRTVSGDTLSTSDRFQASCAGGAQSNDVVYRIRLRRRERVRISMSSDFDGALHLRRDCVDVSTEVACNDDQDDNRHSLLDTVLDAGTYYVIVDGFSASNNGTYTVEFQTSLP